MGGRDKRGRVPRLPTPPGQGGPRRPAAGRPPTAGSAGVPASGSSDRELIYGRHPLREALRGRRRVRRVWLAAGPAGDDVGAALPHWAAEGAVAPPAVTRLEPEALSELARTADHQGVVAEVDPFPYVSFEELFVHTDLLIALDRVQDPHNLGAIIRTAEVAGAGVVIPRHRSAHITGTVVKAAAGATEHVRIAQVRNLTDFLRAATAAGFWVYGAAGEGPAAYDAQDYTGKTIFVLGSEGEGLGQLVARTCDVLVGIPVLGRVDSLNVSVAAGVLLFEAVRQRRASKNAAELGDADRAGVDRGAAAPGASA